MHQIVSESLPTSRAAIAARIEDVRARTLALVDHLSENTLNRVHDPLLSPIVWDLGHIAAFEDLWLGENAFGVPPLRRGLGGVYDPFTAPRSERGALPYLRSDECLDYMAAVRQRTLELLSAADLTPDSGPLLADGFVYELILRHEQQHSETILQTLQAMTAEAYIPARDPDPGPPAATGGADMVKVPAGPFEMGANAPLEHGVFSYDNERARHERDLAAFYIDAAPVTNGDFVAFIADGGYQRPELWSPGGRRWREQRDARMPRYWSRDGDELVVRRFAEVAPVDPQQLVCHVSWFEADAFARYAGK